MSNEKTTPKKESKEEKKQRMFKPGVPFIKAVASGGVKVEFTASPTGKFGLAYSIGDKANFEKKQAEILIDSGVAKKA